MKSNLPQEPTTKPFKIIRTLRKTDKGIEYWVAVLNGYLSAISHINDAVGYRHGYFADLIYLEGLDPKQAIGQYLKQKSPALEEIDLRKEKALIEEYVFHNFLLGKEYEVSEETNFILEQFRWHIQEYISLTADHGLEKTRYLYENRSDDQSFTGIFIHIKELVLVLNFQWRVEQINSN